MLRGYNDIWCMGGVHEIAKKFALEGEQGIWHNRHLDSNLTRELYAHSCIRTPSIQIRGVLGKQSARSTQTL